jgi:hypothetical protein
MPEGTEASEPPLPSLRRFRKGIEEKAAGRRQRHTTPFVLGPCPVWEIHA